MSLGPTYPRVYLAGPILGCTEGEAKDWRKFVDDQLRQANIVGVSPLRCEPIIGKRYGMGYENDPKFGVASAIAAKNMFDVRKCDFTLAYMPLPSPEQVAAMRADGRTWHQSYGTLEEIGWAKMADRPVILVTDDPELANHPVVRACCGWVLDSLEDAIDVLDGILGAYNGGKNV